MVVCNLEVARTPSHLSSNIMEDRQPSKKGFRLLEAHQRNLGDNSETGSIYSVYKQKIDSMFESDSSHGADKGDGNYNRTSSSSTKNSIQARIEKMFVEVAKDGGLLSGGSEVGVHGFSVDYLGSVDLVDRVTNLAGLQEPLKKLYFQYKNDRSPWRLEQKPMSERLEISAMGLKVLYRSDQGEVEHLNPFPTIAVWSAVKFVIQKGDSPFSSTCAFLPLITDPDNLDKQGLFRKLNSSEISTFQSHGIQKTDPHAPLFAVVMRSSVLSPSPDGPSHLQRKRRLECHGFACQTSEDAIVIAATLYKSLMAHMHKAREGRRPKTTREGLSCMSTTSSVLDWNGDVGTPVRPPRKKRSTATSSVASVNSDREQSVDVDETRPLLTTNKSALYSKKSVKTRRAPCAPLPKPEDLDAITPYEEVNNQTSNQSLSDKHSYVNSIIGNLNDVQINENDLSKSGSRSQNLRKSSDGDNQGDILTRVTIPRSGSFLNAGGLTKYKSKLNRANGQGSGGSPLGFHELFNEFRLQEGLHSIDEILGVIIDPEGMSFNDLKPIYKEFLLKLAITLTKDELFQRSKAIMKKQKKKSLKPKSSLYRQKKTSIVSSKLKSIQHIFSKKIKAKLKNKLKKKCIQAKVNKSRTKKVISDEKIPESSISSSSYDTRQFRPKEYQSSVMRKPSYRKKSSSSGIGNYRDLGMAELKNWQQCKERISTSEESDFFSLQRARGRAHANPTGTGSNPNRNSSSGYVSCSECSYDSDTCTCASADKCYCSLGHRNLSDKPRRNQYCNTCKKCHPSKIKDGCYCSWKPAEPNASLTYCECDTDSCSDSNKCYCKTGEKRKNTRHRNSNVIDPKYVDIHRNLCKKNSNTKSTGSLEYVHGPTEQYYEKLRSKIMKHYENDVLPSRNRRSSYDNVAFDMDMWTGNNPRNPQNYRRTRAQSECGNASGLCKAPSIRSFQSATKYVTSKQTGKTVCSTSMSTSGCTEALSVKKSAEIAALFADIKLSQTTDITHLIPPKDYENDSYRRPSSRRSSQASKKGYAKPDKRRSERIGSIPPPIPIGPRVMNNPVYVSQKQEKTKLYSTRNGLYTIPSQSDDSRRSSFSESARNKDNKRDVDERYKDRTVSSNLENSLGYLP